MALNLNRNTPTQFAPRPPEPAGQACAGAKASEIPSQLDSLDSNIGYLESAVADLEVLLQHYAVPPAPAGDGEATAMCETGVGETVRQLAARVCQATYRLQSLYRRLEV